MSLNSFEGLPSPLDALAELIGLEPTLLLADKVGGTRVFFPARVDGSHWLAEMVGLEFANLICDHFRTLSAEGRERGAEIILPRGPTGLLKQAKARFYQAREEGKSVRKAGRLVGVVDRTAFRWENDRKSDGDLASSDQLFLL